MVLATGNHFRGGMPFAYAIALKSAWILRSILSRIRLHNSLLLVFHELEL
jgi:hypothetical protein